MITSTGRALRTTTIVFAVLLVTLAASGCSGSEGDDATSTTTVGTATTSPQASSSSTTSVASADEDPPIPLAGTWVVVNYRMQEGSMTNALGGDAIAMTFGDDGSISGFTGCNDYGGTYEVVGGYNPFEEGVRDDDDGQQITITLTTISENPCEGAFDIEQDADLLASLEGAERWFISRGSLILRGENAFIEASPAS
jgi:heat shock protein HslJ